MDIFYYIITGALVGFTVGVTGVGGGSLMTPFLLGFGFPIHTAVGTDLLYAGLTKTSGMIAHHRLKNVDWRIMALLTVGSLPAAALALVLLSSFESKQQYGLLLNTALGGMLIVTAAVILFRNKLRQLPELHLPAHIVLPLFGLVLGASIALSSVGAGAITAAVLMVLYRSLRTTRVVGTDIAHAAPLTLLAGVGHWYLGNVDFVLLTGLLIGSLPAIALGARFSDHLPEKFIQPFFGVLLLTIGIKLVLS